MKSFTFISICIFIFPWASYDQVSNTSIQEPRSQVHVKDWGNLRMIVGDEIWNNAEKEIISQVGPKEYAVIRKNYDYKSIPSVMSLINADNRKDKKKYFEKMSSLKLYKIASFTNISNGKDWGKLVILRAPYIGNEKWDLNIKWDTVYFIFDENAIQ